MDKKFIVPALFCLIFLTGCSKYYLSLRQVPIDPSYMASSHIGSPEPRMPPHGQKIVLQWAVPPDLLEQNPQIVFHVIYKNHTEKTIVYPIESRMGYEVYTLINHEYEETGGILTYSAEIMTPDHHVYREWKHQLWANLITLDDSKNESER